MTNILTYPTRNKSIIAAAELALIQVDYTVMITSLEQLWDRLVDVNNELEASRSQMAADIAYPAQSPGFDQRESQSEYGEQGVG